MRRRAGSFQEELRVASEQHLNILTDRLVEHNQCPLEHSSAWTSPYTMQAFFGVTGPDRAAAPYHRLAETLEVKNQELADNVAELQRLGEMHGQDEMLAWR